MASRIRFGTRCDSTAFLASASARSLPRRSLAERKVPLLSRLQPTSAGTVWDGIHARSAGGSSSSAVKMSAQADAVSRDGVTARDRPAASSTTTDMQSMRRAACPNPQDTACKTAQVSAPKIVLIHGGGTPAAEARTVPWVSKATNAQPVRRSAEEGPSRSDPSV